MKMNLADELSGKEGLRDKGVEGQRVQSFYPFIPLPLCPFTPQYMFEIRIYAIRLRT